MNIPVRLQARLSENREFNSQVHSTISAFEPWVQVPRPYFFPEYTDHGIAHIEGVLSAASSLISENSWDVFSPSDASALCLSVLLHDSAMHLTHDGFQVLIKDNSPWKPIEGFGDIAWSKAWESFLGQARRFDEKTLEKLFGDKNPIRKPPENYLSWTNGDRLLVGEFLRRNHPRLAHEIALYGVPGSNGNKIKLEGVEPYMADIAGLIARSHGLKLRDCFKHLVTNYSDNREFKKIHAVYLMTLVRVADYLQLEAERAPGQWLKVQRLRSPVSSGEWRAHHAIRDIRHGHADPESIFIDAQPGDAETYLRVRAWLDGIQAELDSSWATLGEVYGRYTDLKELGLILRRVRSNLDDVTSFAEKVSYVPCRASFRAESSEMLKLLIKPLYGNFASYGIRELLQNSVDAVRERGENIPQRCILGRGDLVCEANVAITINREADGSYWLSVEDCGIGMTVDIVLNYFLTAGASFRRSDAWRKEYEDSDGQARIARTGRFGIGALAAFLIGDEVRVSTRHLEVDEDGGIEFIEFPISIGRFF